MIITTLEYFLALNTRLTIGVVFKLGDSNGYFEVYEIGSTIILSKDNGLVYSTDLGRIKQDVKVEPRHSGDGIVRIQRQTKGRKGKGVTCISGLSGTDGELKLLLTELKRHCGCGGTLKNGVIEIQGDKRQQIQQTLEEKKIKVKLVGG